jgi:single-strand DNA-binding protein
VRAGQLLPPSLAHQALAAQLPDPGLTTPEPNKSLQHKNEGLGKIAETYLRKGAKIYVEGAIRTRRWQDQSGADRFTTEIHLSPYNGMLTFLDSKRDGEDRAPRRQPAPAGAGAGGGSGPASDEDSDIPF